MPDVVPGVGVYVDPSTTYCTLAELKADLGITDTADDDKINAAIAAASRQIDRYCGQRFYVDADVSDRVFWADGGDLELDAGISTLTGLVVKADYDGDGVYETTLTANTDFLVLPSNAADLIPVQPYTSLRFGLPSGMAAPRSYGYPGVQITAKWGWPAVPDDVCKAACLQAAQLFKAKDAVFGVAAFGEFGPLRVRSAMNPIAEGLLSPYAIPAVG